MPSFGEQLRQARESQNITLQEIAATTKISSRALQALETEQFDQLPGGIFNKGFVRAYARYVGLDEEKMLAAYMAAAKDNAESETNIQTVSNQIAAARKPVKEPRISGSTLMGVLAVIVGLALGGLWFREHRREAREQAAIQAAQPAPPVAAPQPAPPAPEAAPPDAGATEGAAPGTTGETAPATTPAGTVANSNAAPNAASSSTQGALPNAATPNTPPKASRNVPPNAAPNAASGPAANAAGSKPEVARDAGASEGQPAPVEVSFSATQKAWISVRSDGKAVESLTLDPDNPELRSRSYKAKEKLRVVVGNAGGVTVVCNGKAAGPLGAEGQPKTITFTSQGIVGR